MFKFLVARTIKENNDAIEKDLSREVKQFYPFDVQVDYFEDEFHAQDIDQYVESQKQKFLNFDAQNQLDFMEN